MSWIRLLGVCVLAAGAGYGLGRLTLTSATSDSRPADVELVLRALDQFERRGDAKALAKALAQAPSAGRHPSPWREEVEGARLAAGGDGEALLAFATEPPKAPAKARALLYLSSKGVTDDLKTRAAARLRRDYPDSWALPPADPPPPRDREKPR